MLWLVVWHTLGVQLLHVLSCLRRLHIKVLATMSALVIGELSCLCCTSQVLGCEGLCGRWHTAHHKPHTSL